jgi:hypothetical protein
MKERSKDNATDGGEEEHRPCAQMGWRLLRKF